MDIELAVLIEPAVKIEPFVLPGLGSRSRDPELLEKKNRSRSRLEIKSRAGTGAAKELASPTAMHEDTLL